jgi:hypothetical protein
VKRALAVERVNIVDSPPDASGEEKLHYSNSIPTIGEILTGTDPQKFLAAAIAEAANF